MIAIIIIIVHHHNHHHHQHHDIIIIIAARSATPTLTTTALTPSCPSCLWGPASSCIGRESMPCFQFSAALGEKQKSALEPCPSCPLSCPSCPSPSCPWAPQRPEGSVSEPRIRSSPSLRPFSSPWPRRDFVATAMRRWKRGNRAFAAETLRQSA